MTAALSAILCDGPWDDDALQRLIAQPAIDQELALLVGGDISGVQDFIYTISSRGATSALRGRSFYLQLLSEAIVRFVLAELDLPITNLIYSGGGRFYLLVRPADQDRLRGIQRQISRALLQHHRGDLYVALAAHPLRGMDFFGGKISAAWEQLGDRLQRAKLRRFSELDTSEMARLFQAQGDGGNEDKQCQVCGLEHPGTKPFGDAEAQVRKCPQCCSYEDLGRDLRRAEYLLLSTVDATEAKPEEQPGPWDAALACFGLAASVAETAAGIAQTDIQRGVLLAIKDDALESLQPKANLAVGRRFLVNVTPSLGNEVKPFDKLEDESRGIKRLGVLRMDIDNLGKLFSEGLGQQATLSRVAALSFAISLYFEGWVEKLAGDAAGDRLYSIYSGGDDLFFVGSWDAVVEFARQVRADLTPYAAGHAGIHASAGIVLVGGKYPLAQAARDAGAAEEKAKGHRRRAQGVQVASKDAICFLGEVQPWQRFGLGDSPNTVYALTEQLVTMVQGEGNGRGAPTALIQNLARLYDQYAEAEQKRRDAGADRNQAGEPQPLWGPWMWRGFYMLKRMANRTGDRAIRDKINTLGDQLHETDFRNMAWMGLAARWAELLVRE
jgi:CRISPR-associated protein Csm1